MPTNHTPNYQLSQWSRDDRILMDDFNADNAKIDGALSEGKAAREVLASALTLKGNCQIYMDTYIGTGEYGADNPKSYTFPSLPAILMVCEPGRGYGFIAPRGAKDANVMGTSYMTGVRWSGTTVSWFSPVELAHLNVKGRQYSIVALLAADGS